MNGNGVFAGVRVIELAQHVYVPGAGAMLADQGADVIKIETIEGDPYRTLQVGGLVVNNVPTVRVDQQPYGGIKRSGWGREGPRYAIEEMTELKSMLVTR